jgi:hypothetical protein
MEETLLSKTPLYPVKEQEHSFNIRGIQFIQEGLQNKAEIQIIVQ